MFVSVNNFTYKMSAEIQKKVNKIYKIFLESKLLRILLKFFLN